MDKLVYDQLTDSLKRRGGAFPAIQCDSFYGLLDTIFSGEEARLAAKLPDTPVSADMLSEANEKTPELLENMAKKGILFSIAYAGKRYYVLLPLIPGIIENQLLTGVVNERARKIARFFADYVEYLNKLEAAGTGVFPRVPFARIVAIDREIPDSKQVQPYDRLLQYVDKAEYIAQVVCHCRHMYELLGDRCDKPKDVCLAIGPGARYMADYGLGRLISKDETRRILERAEEAGLVHMVSNTGKYVDFICNCCACHCESLKSLKRSAGAVLAASSGFVSVIDTDSCMGCGDCIVRCPMEALAVSSDTAEVNSALCIGCGLCIRTCPTGALSLHPREGASIPYPDARKLNAAIVSSLNTGAADRQ